MIKPWRWIRSSSPQSFRVFSIRTDRAASPRTGAEHDFYIIESAPWVNIIPVTPDQKVVMIRQYRHGSREITLEIPGGLLDPGETPREAASRELFEETGYGSEKWIKIGEVNPNPALFSNRCHFYVAHDVQKIRSPSFDETEDIEEVLLPLADIPGMIREGTIDHAIVVAAFFFYFLHTPHPQTRIFLAR